MPVPSQGHYGFHSFQIVDWFCLFIYLWVLTFPLLDCSEFGNFVITLTPYTHIYPMLFNQYTIFKAMSINCYFDTKLCTFHLSPYILWWNIKNSKRPITFSKWFDNTASTICIFWYVYQKASKCLRNSYLKCRRSIE